jgi:hypothetical protein
MPDCKYTKIFIGFSNFTKCLQISDITNLNFKLVPMYVNKLSKLSASQTVSMNGTRTHNVKF